MYSTQPWSAAIGADTTVPFPLTSLNCPVPEPGNQFKTRQQQCACPWQIALNDKRAPFAQETLNFYYVVEHKRCVATGGLGNLKFVDDLAWNIYQVEFYAHRRYARSGSNSAIFDSRNFAVGHEDISACTVDMA